MSPSIDKNSVETHCCASLLQFTRMYNRIFYHKGNEVHHKVTQRRMSPSIDKNSVEAHDSASLFHFTNMYNRRFNPKGKRSTSQSNTK